MNALIEKMDRADDGLASTLEAFHQLSLRVGDDLIASWEQEERDALGPGGIGRKIYKAEKEDGAKQAHIYTSSDRHFNRSWARRDVSTPH